MRRLYAMWMRFAHALGLLQSRILLTVVWLVVVLPIGLVRRLWTRPHRFERDAETYRVPSVLRSRESLERPF